MKEDKIAQIIVYINWLFIRLRGSWEDNRWACREGWEAVSRLKELEGVPEEKPYRHTQDDSLEDYLVRIKGNMEQ